MDISYLIQRRERKRVSVKKLLRIFAQDVKEVAPPGWGHTKAEKEKTKPDKPKSKIGGTAAAFKRALEDGRFKGLPGSKTKKEKTADMFKLMWSMKKKGDKPHYKPGTDNKYKKYQEEVDGKKKKKHNCASKVKHEEYGIGKCIPEMHDLDENGNVAHYDVEFKDYIVEGVPVEELEILVTEMHGHVIKETVKNGEVDLILKTDVNNVLKQDNKEYDRGLLAQVNKDGSYDVAYWYDKYKAYPVEVEIDGKTCAKDAKNIHIKFHPELKKESFEYEKLKKKIGSKEKHMKPAITEGAYGKLTSWEKSILQGGLKVRSGASYDKEMVRLIKMYPGFKVEEVTLEGVARFDKLVKTIKNTPDLSKEKEAKLLKVAGKVRGIPEEVSRKRKPSAIRKKKKLEKLLIDKEVSKIQKEEMTYQEMIDAGWEMTGEGIWWPPQDTQTISERMSFKSFRGVLDKKKKKEEKKPEKAQDAGAKARRAMKRREHAKYVSGSEDNVPDDIRD